MKALFMALSLILMASFSFASIKKPTSKAQIQTTNVIAKSVGYKSNAIAVNIKSKAPKTANLGKSECPYSSKTSSPWSKEGRLVAKNSTTDAVGQFSGRK